MRCSFARVSILLASFALFAHSTRAQGGPPSSATFLRTDATTLGNWHAAYGADGYSVAGNGQSLPGYASFAVQNQEDYTWTSNTTDTRALQTADGSNRIAAVWYNASTFDFDVNFADGNPHQLALYALDWDSSGRAETIQIVDATTQTVLDTESTSSFTNGVYLVWNITGHVQINISKTAGNNAVVNGVFFGGSSVVSSVASFVRTDIITQGNWHGAYGADGYSIANDSQSIPSYASFAMQNQQNFTWSDPPTDVRALETGNGSDRIASVWYNSPEFNFDLNLTDGNSHQFALYAVDWDNTGRAETIQILDAATDALLDTRSISNFTNGLFLVWNVKGHVKLNIVQTAGNNAVVSGVFFGANSTISSSAAFLRTDTTTQGNWHGTYGSDGYSVANDSQSVPAYASFAVQNQQDFTWSTSPTDARSLQTGSASGKIAAVWYNTPEFNFDINFTDGNSHQFAFYAVDWDSSGRAETIQILDAATDALLDTRSISNFTNGLYLVWNVSGHVKVNVIQTAGNNAVISGVFFGGGSTINSAASFVRTDTTTQGSWHGAYGSDGYSIANDSQSLPSYANFAVQNQANWTWLSLTTDPRALQTGSNSGSIAATWYNTPEFNLDVNLTDGQSHQLALYAMDWDSSGRAETVELLDAATGALLDTRNISSFVNGLYLVWNVSGHVKINVIQTAGNNAVVSGIFWNSVQGSGGPILQSVSITPSNPSLVLNSSLPMQLTLTGTYSDGSTRNVTAAATWSTSNSSVAQLVPNPNVPGVVMAISTGTANITATYNNLNASTMVTVFAPPPPSNPTITSVSPTTGAQGTQVVITGSGFGASQGTGYVVLGSTLGTVASWSDTQVLVAVASGATSGTVQVQQGGVTSNTLPFTVNTATITSVTPTSGVAGAQVTITGSGFGAAQGNGLVWLGTAPAQVSAWSDTQVAAIVTTGSNSGTARILQNGVWSNSVAFTVTGTPPHITSINPKTGSAGTVVTIQGTGFGSSQGSGVAWIGATQASVNSWSDTHVSATVAASAISGVAKIEQNGLWSNAVTFTVPPTSAGAQLSLNPNVLSMVVGDTHSIQALGVNSQPVTGLTWISSDTTIVTLSTDDPPSLTAVAPGSVTITAGGASADVTVYAGSSLPLGTVIWSAPGDSSGVQNIVPAVPSPTGLADVFGLQADCNVQAITTDGMAAWTNNIGVRSDGSGRCKSLLADFQGGFVAQDPGRTLIVNGGGSVITPGSVQKFDGITGQPYGAYTIANPRTDGRGRTLSAAIHTDGTIFTIDGDSVVAIDPATGSPKFTHKMQHSTCQSQSPSDNFPTINSNPMIAGDGYAYFVYEYTIGSGQNSCQPQCIIESCSPDSGHIEWHSRLVRVGTGGDSSEIALADSSEDWAVSLLGNGIGYQATQVGQLPQDAETQLLITSADQGVLIPLYVPMSGYCASTTLTGLDSQGFPIYVSTGCLDGTFNTTMIVTSGGSVTSRVTLPGSISYIEPDLQAQDGTYFGIVDYSYGPYNDFLAKFDAAGNIQWAIPNYYAQMATADGGVIAQSSDGSTTTTFDANGNATGQLAALPQFQSWLGDGYQLGSIEQVSFLLPHLAQTFAALLAGNFSDNGTSIKQEWFPSLDHCTATPGCIGHYEAIYNSLGDLIARLNNPLLLAGPNGPTTLAGLAQTQIFNKLGTDESGNKFTTQGFLNYLKNKPRFYDGTQSTYCYNVLTGVSESLCFDNAIAHIFQQSVEDHFTANEGAAAVTRTPSKPLLVFFRPNAIGFSSLGQNLGNEGILFHEALHGFTGKDDETILNALGVNPITHASCSIAVVIQNTVLSYSAGLDPTIQFPCPSLIAALSHSAGLDRIIQSVYPSSLF